VYHGLARRAYDLTIEGMPKKTSLALTRSMAYHPEVQHNVAEMRIALDASEAFLDRIAHDWSTGVAHPAWPANIVAMRHRVINESFEIVDRAMDLTGGAGAFKRSRIEQLFRDARMGRFHPGNTLLAHELVSKLSLGLNPDDAPRWG
jgi:alkylation response protein AidB-like acyl-CoA dehydrogenase